MVHIITSVSRFVIIILFAIYTYHCFAALKRGISPKRQSSIFAFQSMCMFLIILDANSVLFLNTQDIRTLIMAVTECAFVFITLFIYRKFYKNISKTIVNNMCMLLVTGFIIISRLNMEAAIRQISIAGLALIATAVVPFFIHRIRFLNKLTWLYALIGIAGLLSVRVLGITEYGAKLSINIAGFSLQPAEIIKILFVFFVACRFYKSTEFNDLVKTTVVAAIHVLIMVSSKDLGGALIFLLTYLIMLYVATGRAAYFLAGIGAGSLASVAAYFMFSHVRTRVIAWKNPLAPGVIDNAGYQVSQSLFAIGTGGWFGSGLTEGKPETIPVVIQDFVFAAISEELGGIFALCLIFVSISLFLAFMNVGILIKNRFYKLLALGLSCVYAMQVFVAIGGVIKYIPATGITLPLVSYGGSSILGTMLLFAIIQGLYVYSHEELIKEQILMEKHEGRYEDISEDIPEEMLVDIKNVEEYRIKMDDDDFEYFVADVEDEDF